LAENPLVVMVTRAQQGDMRAFDCLVRHFQNAAVAYARTLLRDPAAAEDAAQEAFVQAWQDLPRLTEAAAFGAWLRRIVFKYCDRTRRSARFVLPLSDVLPAPREEEPAVVLERTDQSARVHAALEALPCALREATLLYYLTGHNVKEIAAFLEVPPSTVKNRLHTARKRLRKELWEMTESMMSQEKPSRNEEFANQVLARVRREFERQESADPHTADRSLLEAGRKALFEVVWAGRSLDEETVRDGFTVLWRKQDWTALSALLMRYLGRPLSDSEAAWAYLHLANALAIPGSAAGAVLAHEAFERWQSGRTPCLCAQWPYYPVSEDASERVYAGDDVRLLFLSQSAEFTTSYLGVWRNNEYLAKVDAAFAEIPPTPKNRPLRFFVRRMASNACETVGDFDRAQGYIRPMYDLAEEEENEARKAEFRAMALGHDMKLAHLRNDDTAFMARAQEFTTLLEEQERRGLSGAKWVRGQRHELANLLAHHHQHELALPLFEENLANGGQIGGWGWLMHAATVWQVTRDRARTLPLLQEARAHDDRDMAELLAECPEFADMQDDPEFMQALSRSQ
jgi:RNA polymerase sigma factor (sigma-70 family)